MNVEIGAEAALFPEKEYISGIFVAVWQSIAGQYVLINTWSGTLLKRYFMPNSKILYCSTSELNLIFFHK
jgi:hypothetical protein